MRQYILVEVSRFTHQISQSCDDCNTPLSNIIIEKFPLDQKLDWKHSNPKEKSVDTNVEIPFPRVQKTPKLSALASRQRIAILVFQFPKHPAIFLANTQNCLIPNYRHTFHFRDNGINRLAASFHGRNLGLNYRVNNNCKMPKLYVRKANSIVGMDFVKWRGCCNGQ